MAGWELDPVNFMVIRNNDVNDSDNATLIFWIDDWDMNYSGYSITVTIPDFGSSFHHLALMTNWSAQYPVTDMAIDVDDFEVWNGLPDMPTSVKELNLEVSREFQLLHNYPNPFNSATIIKYYLSEQGRVTLKIYNFTGQEIASLINDFQTAGEHEIKWNPSNLASGIYFCKLQIGKIVINKKLILQK